MSIDLKSHDLMTDDLVAEACQSLLDHNHQKKLMMDKVKSSRF